MGKDKKQFPLNSKDNCCIYLCRIISSCELCMDKLKKYNKQTELELGKHSSKDLIPYEIYSELSDKSYNIISYLLIYWVIVKLHLYPISNIVNTFRTE